MSAYTEGEGRERALVPVAGPSRALEQSFAGQQGLTLAGRVTELVVGGQIPDFVLLSPTVGGGMGWPSVGEKLTDPTEITRHPHRVLLLPRPLVDAKRSTFLMIVSLSDARPTSALSYNANSIERHGQFLVNFSESERTVSTSYSEYLQAWAGRAAYAALDKLFPDTSEFAFQNQYRPGELVFDFSHPYPPEAHPTEFKFARFTARESGPITIAAVNSQNQPYAEQVISLNSSSESNLGRAIRLIAAAEQEGGELGAAVLKRVLGSNLWSTSVDDDTLARIKGDLEALLTQCQSDLRHLEMFRLAARQLVADAHPDRLSGANINNEVRGLLTNFHQALSKEANRLRQFRETER